MGAALRGHNLVLAWGHLAVSMTACVTARGGDPVNIETLEQPIVPQSSVYKGA
jgi:hypothetical protein